MIQFPSDSNRNNGGHVAGSDEAAAEALGRELRQTYYARRHRAGRAPTQQTIQRIDSAHQMQRLRRAAPLATKRQSLQLRSGLGQRPASRRLAFLLGALLLVMILVIAVATAAKASGPADDGVVCATTICPPHCEISAPTPLTAFGCLERRAFAPVMMR